MPVSLGLVQACVVAVLGFVYALLDAHVARDAVALGEQLVRGQQPGETAVAVGDGVDREQVEDQCRDEDEGVRAALALGIVVAGHQLRQEELGLLRGGRGEDDLAPAALVRDDQVLIALEMTAMSVDVLEEQAVQVQDERSGE